MYTNNMATLFAEGGMNDEGGTVDPVSGNDVPPGAMQNEVRDDISAKLSEGEFVIPADVVRYIGLERLMKLRDEAKQGLSRMSEIGQMGNADQVANPEALHEGDDGFGSEIDDIMKEVDGEQMGEKQFAAGGFNEPGTDYLAKYNIPKTSITNPALDVRAYKNKEGRVMYITFFNDKPSIAIPAGYEFAGSAGQFIAETKKTEDTKKDVVTATETIQGGDGNATSGGPSVGTGSGVGGPSGTSVGNSPIGIAIGAIANALDGITSNTIGTPVSVSDAVTTTGVSTSANAAGLAANAAALAADDASVTEGVTGGISSNGAPGTVGSTAATAAADNSGNTNSNDSGDGGTSGGGGGTGAGAGTGNAMAKGGLVAKRTKKPTLAQKRGIASKK